MAGSQAQFYYAKNRLERVDSRTTCLSVLLRSPAARRQGPGERPSENDEIKSFVEALAPQLANAISLRTSEIANKQLKRQAAKIKAAIITITNSQATHPAILKIQDIFREKADRLYHRADAHNIPADNNLAERELRPLVIARKINSGSQSDADARTREVLMTVLHTLKKRASDVATAFKSALDKLAEQPGIDLAEVLLSLDCS